MFETRFGIEIEFTGVTRAKAASIASEVLGGSIVGTGVSDTQHRIWRFVSDSSIVTQRKRSGGVIGADSEYAVELVSPILTYREDIETLQELVRRLRKAGGFANNSCGIHIHLDNAGHDSRTIRNFVNIIASKNDLFYKALAIEDARARYCKKMDEYMVERMNKAKPKSLNAISNIWYEGYDGDRLGHYHQSRYHFLNLHSFFSGNHTVELRGFNSTLHAGKIRSYIVLALALNNQALTQRYASPKKNQTENEKFAMRTYLNRIGLIGDEFKNCREHLCSNLSGNAAWRLGSREATPRRTAIVLAGA